MEKNLEVNLGRLVSFLKSFWSFRRKTKNMKTRDSNQLLKQSAFFCHSKVELEMHNSFASVSRRIDARTRFIVLLDWHVDGRGTRRCFLRIRIKWRKKIERCRVAYRFRYLLSIFSINFIFSRSNATLRNTIFHLCIKAFALSKTKNSITYL